MRFQVLASGSAGNMTYIESKDTKILLDAGISLKEVARRGNIDFSSLDAILITHEHSDHISNLLTISKKIKCKIYMSKICYEKMIEKDPSKYEKLPIEFLNANEKYRIKDINFMPLELSHDSADCFGYFFVSCKESLAYLTDTGFVPIPYLSLLNKANSLIIESNHDIEMLQNCDRPWPLKQRILSVNGHMSNLMCGEVLNRILKENKLKNVVLAHISRDCNTEELAIDTVLAQIEGDYIPKIYLAKQDESLEFIEVCSNEN